MKEINMKKEHILVCLSSSPSNPKVIKAGATMANNSNAEFSALYIETSRILDEEDKKRLEDNSILAKNLGAKIVTLNGDNIPYQVSNYAKRAGVTKLIIGRSGYKQSKIFGSPSFIDKLIPLIPEVEVYIIPDKAQKLYINKNKRHNFEIPKLTIKDTLVSIAILVGATLLGGAFHKFSIYDANIIMVYILAILYVAYKTKSAIYSLLSSCFAVFIYNFLFVEPYFSTHFNNKNYALTFLIMLIVALIASSMTKKVQEQTHDAVLKTYRTETLLDLSQKLQECVSEEEINNALKEQLQRLLECEIDLYTEKNGDEVLDWVLENNKSAGIGTKNFADIGNLYIPISNNEKMFAIIRIEKKNISEFERNLISAMIRETVLAQEKILVTKTNNELIIKNRQEELRTTLLRTISHDLRTPLTGISGYAELLIKNASKLSEEKKNGIYTDIYEDSIWLLNLVENLLSITRFDKDKIEIKQELEFVPDIVIDAVSHLGRKKEKYNIKTEFPDDDLYAKMDGRLIAQVIFNLVDNATKYSPENTTITIKAEKVGEDIEISVADEGVGISDENKAKIFDLFYTVKSNSSADSRRGLGLGLALCKTVINAHSSNIQIKDNQPKGTVISFKLKGYEDE